MEATLLIALLGVLAILWFVLSNRMDELQQQLDRAALVAVSWVYTRFREQLQRYL